MTTVLLRSSRRLVSSGRLFPPSLVVRKPTVLQYSTLSCRNSALLCLRKQQQQHQIQQQQQHYRHYWYIPTSWTELRLRMHAAQVKKKRRPRTIQLRLSQRLADFWTRTKSKTSRKSAEMQAKSAQMQEKYQNKYQNYRHHKYQQRQRSLEWWKNQKMAATGRYQALWLRTRQRLHQQQRLLAVTLTEYSEKDWFHQETGRPVVSRDLTGRFVNPWRSTSTDGVHSLVTLVQWRWQRVQNFLWQQWMRKGYYVDCDDDDDKSRQRQLEESSSSSSSCQKQTKTLSTTTETTTTTTTRMTWIGHATCLLQHPAATILTDPIFSTRSSPFQNSPIGVARDVPPSCSIDELPGTIDICLISHDHYDHLDYDSVQQLKDRVRLWVVPRGIEDWLREKCDIAKKNTLALEWWESVALNPQDMTVRTKHSLEDAPHHHPYYFEQQVQEQQQDQEKEKDNTSSIWLTCLPAQHWGSRTLWDRNYRLWCSFACFLPQQQQQKDDDPFVFFFAGDTARPKHFPLFEQMRDYLGRPVDLAALPIGAYEPAAMCQDAHMNPAEATLVHQALEAKQSVGIHWGTFALGEEPWYEPAEWLQRVAPKNFVTLNHGECLEMVVAEPAEATTAVVVSSEEKEEEEGDAGESKEEEEEDAAANKNKEEQETRADENSAEEDDDEVEESMAAY